MKRYHYSMYPVLHLVFYLSCSRDRMFLKDVYNVQTGLLKSSIARNYQACFVRTYFKRELELGF